MIVGLLDCWIIGLAALLPAAVLDHWIVGFKFLDPAFVGSACGCYRGS